MSEERGGSLLKDGKALAVFFLLSAGVCAMVYTTAGKVGTHRQSRVSMDRLNEIRSALRSYTKTEGQPPKGLGELVDQGLIAKLPATTSLLEHQDSDAVLKGTGSDDAGGWLYDDDPSSQTYGTVWINCTHVASKRWRWRDF